jgi:hypothetical protein
MMATDKVLVSRRRELERFRAKPDAIDGQGRVDNDAALSTGYVQLMLSGRRSRHERARLGRDDLSSNRHPALSIYLSTIFLEDRYPLFRIML